MSILNISLLVLMWKLYRLSLAHLDAISLSSTLFHRFSFRMGAFILSPARPTFPFTMAFHRISVASVSRLTDYCSSNIPFAVSWQESKALSGISFRTEAKLVYRTWRRYTLQHLSSQTSTVHIKRLLGTPIYGPRGRVDPEVVSHRQQHVVLSRNCSDSRFSLYPSCFCRWIG